MAKPSLEQLGKDVEALRNRLNRHLGTSPAKSQLNTPHPKVDPDDIVKPGLIVMWSGAEADIPDGWKLCDGTDNTPDLRDKFIVGAGSTYAVGATGGATEVTLTTAQIPAHAHGAGSLAISNDTHNHDQEVRESSANDGDGGGIGAGPNLITITSGISDETHSHGISGNVADEGGGEAHENLPPYYALAFIMKVATD